MFRFFPVKSEVRWGCILASTLFNLCIDWVMRERLHNLSTMFEPQPQLQTIWIKTNIQELVSFIDENIDLITPVTIQGKHVSFVGSFVYLGSTQYEIS